MNAKIEDKSAANERHGDVLTWLATILACTYIVWAGTALYFSTPIFINMYTSMGGGSAPIHQNFNWILPLDVSHTVWRHRRTGDYKAVLCAR